MSTALFTHVAGVVVSRGWVELLRGVALGAVYSGPAMPRRGFTFFCLPKRNVSKDNEVSAQANFRFAKVKRSGRSQKGTSVRRSPSWATPLRCSPRRVQETNGDSNSRDPLPGHALRHESAARPGPTYIPALLGGSLGPQKRRGANSRAASYLTFYVIHYCLKPGAQ